MRFWLGLVTFEHAHSGRKVVDAAGGFEGGDNDGGGRDEIVGEGVVEVALGVSAMMRGGDGGYMDG